MHLNRINRNVLNQLIFATYRFNVNHFHFINKVEDINVSNEKLKNVYSLSFHFENDNSIYKDLKNYNAYNGKIIYNVLDLFSRNLAIENS